MAAVSWRILYIHPWRASRVGIWRRRRHNRGFLEEFAMGKQNKVFGIPRRGLLKGDVAELIMMLGFGPQWHCGRGAVHSVLIKRVWCTSCVYEGWRKECREGYKKRQGESEREKETQHSQSLSWCKLMIGIFSWVSNHHARGDGAPARERQEKETG